MRDTCGTRSLVLLLAGCCLLGCSVQGTVGASPLCSSTSSGGQKCKVYNVEDCQNLADIPLLRDVHCPAAWRAVQDMLEIVALKSHAPQYDGYMEFYVDDLNLVRDNNTCKDSSHLLGNGNNMSLTPSDAVCHLLTTVTSPGAKATWWFGALRPLPTFIGKLLAARPRPIMTFGRFSPSWNALINNQGISIEARYIIDSMVDFVKNAFSSLFSMVKVQGDPKHTDKSQTALTAGGGGGWGGAIILSDGQKAVDFGGGGGGSVAISSTGNENIRVDGGAGTTVMEHVSSKDGQYYPTLGVSGRSNGMDILPLYQYSRDSTQNGYDKNTTTSCYAKNILGEYLIAIQDTYHQLKDIYASGGMFVMQGGGGQGASLLFNLPSGDISAFGTGSGFMFDYMFYDADKVRRVMLLEDPYDALYKELGRIYQEASDVAAKACAGNTDPMCECQARYEYVVMEAKKYADPLPSWITTNTCEQGSSTDLNSCSLIKVVS